MFSYSIGYTCLDGDGGATQPLSRDGSLNILNGDQTAKLRKTKCETLPLSVLIYCTI